MPILFNYFTSGNDSSQSEIGKMALLKIWSCCNSRKKLSNEKQFKPKGQRGVRIP